MRNDEEYQGSVDELITYDEADTPEETEEGDTVYDDGGSLPELMEEDDSSFEIDEDGNSVFEIDEEYNTEPYTDDASEAEKEEKNDEDEEYFDNLPDEETAEKFEGKSIKRIAIAGAAVIAITGIIAFLCIDTGFVAAYKTNFAKNFNHLFGNLFTPVQTAVQNEPAETGETYNTGIRGSVVISPGDIANAQVLPYKDGIVCASPNHLMYIDFSGNTVWEENTLIVEPLLSVRGNYILIAEKNRNKLCLYNDKKMIFDADDQDNIVAVNVSPIGDCVVITDKSSYRGGISVYNKMGEQIYSWASGSDAVISADIASPSRKVAVSLLNTEATPKSVIHFFDMNETKSYSQINVENTVIFELKFTGNTLSAFGDNRMVVLSDNGKIVSDNDMQSVQLTHSAMDENGGKLLSYDNGTTPMLAAYDQNGTEEMNTPLKGIPDFVDIEGKTILYNIGRDVYCGRPSIDNITKYTAAMDIRKLMLISQNAFVIVYSNSIEIVRI